MPIIDEAYKSVQDRIHEWEKSVATKWLRVMLSLVEDGDETALRALRVAIRAIKAEVAKDEQTRGGVL